MLLLSERSNETGVRAAAFSPSSVLSLLESCNMGINWLLLDPCDVSVHHLTLKVPSRSASVPFLITRSSPLEFLAISSNALISLFSN